MRPTKTFDQERVHLNLAKMKKGGEHFEVVFHPDKIMDYRKKLIDIKEVLVYEQVYSDAKKGLDASAEHMKALFGTDDQIAVAKIVLEEGEIQFTQEYRESKRKEKRNRILDIISRNAIDPRSGLPHPRARIESAMDEAKVRIDDMKDAEDQVNDIVHAMKPIMPIKLAMKEIQIRLLAQYAGKAHGTIDRFGKITQETWLTDGSWQGIVDLPAGLQNDFFDALNKLTHGSVESKVIREK
jgi:ribosome maturation protein SDO1